MKKKFMFCYYFKLLKGNNLKRHGDSKHTFYFFDYDNGYILNIKIFTKFCQTGGSTY